MVGYEFDFDRIKKRITQMTNNPDKTFSRSPLRKIVVD